MLIFREFSLQQLEINRPEEFFFEESMYSSYQFPVICVYIKQSSTLMRSWWKSSVINRENRSGPMIVPWGTPLGTLVSRERIPLYITFCFLLLIEFAIQFVIWIGNLYVSNFLIRKLCGILSKAFRKSKYITSIGIVLSKFSNKGE